MAFRINLPAPILAQIAQVEANILLQHRGMPLNDSIVVSIEQALAHINDWSFITGYGYVNVAGSKKEGRWRYACTFHSRKEGEDTRNYRKMEEKGRQRTNTHSRGISCPIGITIRR